MAAVPELNAAACTPLPNSLPIADSKAFTCGPKGAIQLVAKASDTYFSSFPPMCGEESHIFVGAIAVFNTKNLGWGQLVTKLSIVSNKMVFSYVISFNSRESSVNGRLFITQTIIYLLTFNSRIITIYKLK